MVLPQVRFPLGLLQSYPLPQFKDLCANKCLLGGSGCCSPRTLILADNTWVVSSDTGSWHQPPEKVSKLGFLPSQILLDVSRFLRITAVPPRVG